LATIEMELHRLANLKAFRTSPVGSGPARKSEEREGGKDEVPGAMFTITDVLAPPPSAPCQECVGARGRERRHLQEAGELGVAVRDIFGSVSIVADSRLLFAQGRDAIPECGKREVDALALLGTHIILPRGRSGSEQLRERGEREEGGGNLSLPARSTKTSVPSRTDC
jgi:hypothetical protein